MTKSGWIIALLSATAAILFAAVTFLIGRASAPSPDGTDNRSIAAESNTQQAAPVHKARAQEQASNSPTPAPPEPAEALATGPAFAERFNDLGLTLRFVPTAQSRRLIEYRQDATSATDDSSCTPPYQARERVTRITYEHGFVIDRFWTWNEREGQQEYIVTQSSLPNAFQGSLHDLVRRGRQLTITKQRCGQGQVAGLIGVR